MRADPTLRSAGRVRPGELASVPIAAAVAVLILGAGAAIASPAIGVGHPLRIDRPVSGRVVSVLGEVVVSSRVAGDVVVWGADVVLEPGARVEGDVLDFGGSLRRVRNPGAPDSVVAGRVLTPGSLAGLYLAETEKAPWRVGAGAPRVLLALRLFVLAGWLVAAMILMLLWDGALARAALEIDEEPGTTMLAGLLSVVTLLLAAICGLSLLPEALGAPVAIFVAGVAVAAKVFGMAALFLLVGQKALGDVSPRRRPVALAVGFAVLGGLSLVPVAGAVLWSAASVAAVGASLRSRFGTPRFRVAVAS
jgi:hypothetical protein